MRRIWFDRILTALLLTVVCAARVHHAHAQNANAQNAHAQSAVAGQWKLRYEYRPNSLHGGEAPVQQREALLTLRLSADSIFGEWQATVPKGDSTPTPAPRALRGVIRHDSVLVQLDQDVDKDAGVLATIGNEIVEFIKTYVHGMPPTTSALNLQFRGDSLIGTRRSVLLDGTPRGVPAVMTGVRVNR